MRAPLHRHSKRALVYLPRNNPAPRVADRRAKRASEPAVCDEIHGTPHGGDEGREPAASHSGAGATHEPRSRRDHRHRHLRAHGPGGPRQDRAGPDAVVRSGRNRLHLRGAVLCRIRLDGAGRGLCLHLCLRDAGRALRLDHRVGPHSRIRRRFRHRRAWMVALLSGLHRNPGTQDSPRVLHGAVRLRSEARAFRLDRHAARSSRYHHHDHRDGHPREGDQGEGGKLALATVSSTVAPLTDVQDSTVVQLWAGVYAYYTSIGVTTAGYPLMDTQNCAFFDLGNSCTYDSFDKGYALFVYASPLAGGQNFTISGGYYRSEER